MVRPKMQLEKLEGKVSREEYYLHNKSIVAKKVKEMSFLTGTHILFLAFSPSNIPTLHLGHHSNFVSIVRRFSQISYHDREKRRHDNLQTMKSNYEKEGYSIDVQKLSDAWKVKKIEELRKELDKIKNELIDLKLRKSYWENPQNVSSCEMIKDMEESLLLSLQFVLKRKIELTSSTTHFTSDRARIEIHSDLNQMTLPTTRK
ncbi:agamous-like MADS-box protein AGL65 [Amaranthus tricolor]|uniref:agamous-like MADS-box protein AGL65 n=1 Tax=Amaranthus tricolor TaxID=29722 RepID=UPI00258D7A09|nr:agamous-like MADS-box protein AGL65 [Amaranthus tricolor]